MKYLIAIASIPLALGLSLIVSGQTLDAKPKASSAAKPAAKARPSARPKGNRPSCR